jgi:hypothetical protein
MASRSLAASTPNLPCFVHAAKSKTGRVNCAEVLGIGDASEQMGRSGTSLLAHTGHAGDVQLVGRHSGLEMLPLRRRAAAHPSGLGLNQHPGCSCRRAGPFSFIHPAFRSTRLNHTACHPLLGAVAIESAETSLGDRRRAGERRQEREPRLSLVGDRLRVPEFRNVSPS